VDPGVVVGCVESTMWICGLTSSGYDFLNKMVTLPFSVPEMSPDSKCRAFKTLADSYLEPDWECFKRGKHRAGNFSAFEKGRLDDSLVPFIEKGKSETELLENGIHWEVWAKKIKALTNEAFTRHIYQIQPSCLSYGKPCAYEKDNKLCKDDSHRHGCYGLQGLLQS
jgi:hypothetical protein